MAATRDEPQQRTGLTPERWERIKSILTAALEMDARERLSYLDSACRDDDFVRSEVESLLRVESEFPDDLQLPDTNTPYIGLQTATRLGDCEIDALLGSGGMGEVYRARDLRLNREVAIKVLPRLLSSNPDRLWRFEQEARAAATLNHPNILSIYQMGTHEGAPYLVSELLEGETLRSLVKRGPLPPAAAVEYAIQACRGLAAAHQKGIVHRDLKPENLFVTTEGTIKILDFGLAKLKDRDLPAENASRPVGLGSTQAGAVLGTAGYMSPEQVRGEGTDQRSDIFSFGAILFEMLTGTRAFQGESFDEVARAVLEGTPSHRELREPQVPESLRNLVLRCLAKNPAGRYQSANELLSELESMSRGVNFTRDGARLLPDGRRKLAAISGIAVIAVLGAGAFWHFTHSSRQHAGGTGSESPDADEVLIPLISLSGEEHQPVFSPDGTRVAFVLVAPNAKDSGIYEIQVGSQNLHRLTTSIGDYSPTWSPDGRQVAYLHDSKDEFTIYIEPAAGGSARELYVGRRSQVNQLYPRSSGLSFSQDGKWLAFSGTDNGQEDSIKLLSIEDSSVRSLTSHPPGIQDHYPAFSPAGDELVFVRSSGPIYVDELYVTSLRDGDTRKLTSDHGRVFGPPAFTADGRDIVFSSNRAGIESLWRIPVAGGNPRPVSRSGPGAWNPTISRNGDYLAYELSDDEQNIWRLRLEEDKMHTQGSPQILIPSGRAFNMLPQFSPDGSKIAFQSSRTGYAEIWICKADGSNLMQVTNARTLTGSPSWSPDGRYLAFDSRPAAHSEIQVIEVPGGPTHTVAKFPDAESVIPSWSHDGNWIYFSSNRGGKDFHIWKVRIKNGAVASDAPVQISRSIGFAALEARDGRSVLFANPSIPGIWSVPRDGGSERLVWSGPGPDLWSNWVLVKDGLYFFSPGRPGPEIEFLNLSTRQITRFAKLDKPSFFGLALAPDGRSLIYSQQDRSDHQILVLKHFH